LGDGGLVFLFPSGKTGMLAKPKSRWLSGPLVMQLLQFVGQVEVKKKTLLF